MKNLIQNTLRVCSKCGEKKGVENFYFRSGRSDTVCKECKRTAQKNNYQKSKSGNLKDIIGRVLKIVIQTEISELKKINFELEELLKTCQTNQI